MSIKINNQSSSSSHFHIVPDTDPFIEVPRDVVKDIFSYLGIKDVCHLSLVCKRFQTICNEASLWKQLFQKNYSSIYRNEMISGDFKTKCREHSIMRFNLKHGFFHPTPVTISFPKRSREVYSPSLLMTSQGKLVCFDEHSLCLKILDPKKTEFSQLPTYPYPQEEQEGKVKSRHCYHLTEVSTSLCTLHKADQIDILDLNNENPYASKIKLNNRIIRTLIPLPNESIFISLKDSNTNLCKAEFWNLKNPENAESSFSISTNIRMVDTTSSYVFFYSPPSSSKETGHLTVYPLKSTVSLLDLSLNEPSRIFETKQGLLLVIVNERATGDFNLHLFDPKNAWESKLLSTTKNSPNLILEAPSGDIFIEDLQMNVSQWDLRSFDAAKCVQVFKQVRHFFMSSDGYGFFSYWGKKEIVVHDLNKKEAPLRCKIPQSEYSLRKRGYEDHLSFMSHPFFPDFTFLFTVDSLHLIVPQRGEIVKNIMTGSSLPRYGGYPLSTFSKGFIKCESSSSSCQVDLYDFLPSLETVYTQILNKLEKNPSQKTVDWILSTLPEIHKKYQSDKRLPKESLKDKDTLIKWLKEFLDLPITQPNKKQKKE